MSRSEGFRGYVGSRPIKGNRVPQHIQNLVVRHYCETLGIRYLLSTTETAMERSFLALRQVVSEISSYQGIVAYSIGQLPEDRCERRQYLEAIVEAGREIHFAVERIAVRSKADIEYTETIVLLESILPLCISSEEFKSRMKNSSHH